MGGDSLSLANLDGSEFAWNIEFMRDAILILPTLQTRVLERCSNRHAATEPTSAWQSQYPQNLPPGSQVRVTRDTVGRAVSEERGQSLPREEPGRELALCWQEVVWASQALGGVKVWGGSGNV